MKHKLLVILGVFLVSFAAVFVKLIDVEPSVLAMYRLGIGGLLLLPFALKNKDFKRIKVSDVKFISLAGLMIGLHYLSWFTSLRYTSITSSTLIICSQPIVALIFGYLFYRDKIKLNQFIVLLFALSGVTIVVWGDISLNQDSIIGNFLTFVAVVFIVIYLLIGQGFVRRFSFIVYTSLLLISASLFLLVYNIIMGYELFDYDNKVWLIIFLLAVIPNAGQVLFNYTLRYVKTSLISTAILLEPIFASILAVIILKDHISFTHYLGGIVIILSVYIYIQLDRVKVKKG